MKIPELDYLFHPRSVAVCGSFTHPHRWFLKEYYYHPFRRAGYRGSFYVVDPRGGEINGTRVYRSVLDLPSVPEHVVCCVPAQKAPALIQDCARAGTKVVQIFTAGFAETGDPEGIHLQADLVAIAREAGIRVIGPNCMGLYYPAGGLSFSSSFPSEPGPIGLLCQSGGNTTYITRLCADRGLRFSKVISYGNACDINECDLLEYLAEDPETGVIAAYIEGTRDAVRFLDILSWAASAKPVVVFKGGYTEGGRRAAESHTASLAGSDEVWEGVLRQAGAIRVYSVEEMVDMLTALLRMEPPAGPNVCAVGNGGGSSVLASDECEQAGLKVVPIPETTRERLKSFIPAAGSMLRNPIDGGFMIVVQNDGTFFGQSVATWEDKLDTIWVGPEDGSWGQFLEAIDDWPGLDMVIFHFSVDINPIEITEWRVGTAVGQMLSGAKACRYPKAMVLQMMAGLDSRLASEKAWQMCTDAGLAVFPSLRGAATAIHRLLEFDKTHPGMVSRLQGRD